MTLLLPTKPGRWIPLAILASCASPTRGADADPGTSAPVRILVDRTTGMELIFVAGGCFQMGDVFGDGEEEERPVHEVCLEDFYIGKYEVTQGQWKRVMEGNPSLDRGCKGDDTCPVDSVSWSDAQEFIARLNRGSGPGGRYRLPTEA
jgi:sulfatase modifying factor 1